LVRSVSKRFGGRLEESVGAGVPLAHQSSRVTTLGASDGGNVVGITEGNRLREAMGLKDKFVDGV
jgi:hypothetical protein